MQMYAPIECSCLALWIDIMKLSAQGALHPSLCA